MAFLELLQKRVLIEKRKIVAKQIPINAPFLPLRRRQQRPHIRKLAIRSGHVIHHRLQLKPDKIFGLQHPKFADG